MNKKSIIPFFILSLIIVTIYVPFVFKGGFGPSDDLALLADSGKKFSELVLGSITKPGHVSRPIYGLIQVFTLVTFGNNPIPYNILKLVLLFITVALLSYTVRTTIGLRASWIFSFFASLPIFCSSHVFSSFQMGYLLSILFWALSLFLLHGYIFGRRKINYYLSFFFVLLALLSCEIILPLLIVTALLPIVYLVHTQGRGSIGDLPGITLRFISPIILLSFGFYIFKVYLSKYYQIGEGTYGLSPVTMKSFLQGGYYFFTLVVEIPLMLIMVIPYLFEWEILLLSILIVSFFMFLRKIGNENELLFHKSNPSQERMGKQFVGIMFFSLVACASIFFLSGYPAVTFGNYNKMMLPSFVLVCVLIGWGIDKLLMTRWIVVVMGVSILWTSSMVVQVRNFSDSWQIREKVLYDFATNINTTDLGIQPHIIACIPFFTKKNYNNEHVFWLTWDFSSGVKLYGSKKIIFVFPFCWQTLVNADYYPLHNINSQLTEQLENENLWYYEFDYSTNRSDLRKLDNYNALEKQLRNVIDKKINYHPILFRQRIKMKLKGWIFERNII